jgi:hypothetical protein
MVLPVSRSSAEAHLYMDLHGCSCGQTGFDRDSEVVALADGDLGRRYSGACAGCGTPREFVFRLPAEAALPPAGRVSFGGPEPSQLLDPGEWLAVADGYAAQAPADPAGLTPEQARHGRAVLDRAAAALDEVLKFVPEGGESVPEGAFFSDRGREVFAREPGRFRGNRLTAVRDVYAGLAGQFA